MKKRMCPLTYPLFFYQEARSAFQTALLRLSEKTLVFSKKMLCVSKKDVTSSQKRRSMF